MTPKISPKRLGHWGETEKRERYKKREFYTQTSVPTLFLCIAKLMENLFSLFFLLKSLHVCLRGSWEVLIF